MSLTATPPAIPTRQSPGAKTSGAPAFLDIDLARAVTVTAITTAMARHPYTVALRPNLILACDQNGWTGTFTTTLRHLINNLLADGPVQAVVAYEADPATHAPSRTPRAEIISDTITGIVANHLRLAHHSPVPINDERLLGVAL